MNDINRYLDVAEFVARKSTCLRANYGCVIVKDGQIVSYGYNEVPNGRNTCKDLGYCIKEKLKIPHGDGYSKCRAICSEQNAIIKAQPEDLVGATLYLVGINPKTNNYVDEGNAKPCVVCERFIINSGIKEVYVRLNETEYKLIKTEDLINNDTSF